jgi:hypothetical protein
MQHHNDRDRALDRSAGEHLDHAGDHAEEAAHHAGEAARHTKEAMEAGASGTLERTREAARDAGRTVGHVASDAASAVGSAARSTAEGAAHAAGAAAGAVSGTVAAVRNAVGPMASRIADRVGGWWSQAKDAVPELPKVQLEACDARLSESGSAGIDAEVARAAYALGYMAAQNPGYRDRGFDQIEPEVRHGYAGSEAEYGSWRDFTRHGYEQGGRR